MAKADRIIELLHEARARPAGAERDRFLAKACGDDAVLEEQIVSLLKADAREGASDFLKDTLLLRPTAPVTEKPGDRIGRYKLLEQIGEGGCGVVYMAEQEEPVRRRVALKVIKLGMDTKQVIARFEAERQALAMMDHPNIAKVLDGGSTDTGRPFFVMELVRGIRITDYCDQNNLSTRERLELFMQVCQAVQHAHQKGIIHRDIKPSNILVTQHDDVAMPKVIDFGIAKATIGQLTDKTVFTAFAQFLGTPAYMSPEQAQMSGLDIDTRADIYSLGVLLYELLTGNTPFDAKALLAAGMDEMRRKIREDEPARPSTCLSTMQAMELTTVARRRHVEPPRLIHLIRGDLDWLVMKCLEKDRTRRYETANGLAIDLQRHLNDEPVIARPPSTLYRFQKLVRRHKLAFAAASSVTAALVLGLGISTCMFVKERQARQRAVAAEQEQSRLRRQAEAEAAESGRIAMFLNTLADSFWQERNPGRAEPVFRESLAMRLKLYGNEHRDVGDVFASLAQVLQQGKLAGADLTAPVAAQKCHAALAQFNELASDPRRRQECWLFAVAYERLGQLFKENGRIPEAEAVYRDTTILWRKWVTDFNLEDHHWHLGVNYDALGQLLKEAGRFDEAAEAFRQALAVWKKLVAEFNKDDYRNHLTWTMISLAEALQIAGKGNEAGLAFGEAESAIREDLSLRKQRFGEVNREVDAALASLTQVLEQEGNLAKAETASREELAMERKLSGDEHPFVANSLAELTSILLAEAKFIEAEPLARGCLAIREKKLPDDWLTFSAQSLLGGSLLGQKKFPEAELLLLSGYKGMKQREDRIPAIGKSRLKEALERLVQLYEATGPPEKAVEWNKKLAEFNQP